MALRLDFLRRLVKNLIRFISLLTPRDDNLWVFCAGQGDKFMGNSKYEFLYAAEKEDIEAVWITTDPSIRQSLDQDGYRVYLIGTLYAKFILLRAGAVLYTHSIPSSQYAVGAEKVYLMHGNYLKHMGADNRPKSETSALKQLERQVGELFGKPDTFYTITSTGKPREIVQSAYDPVESNLLVTGFPRNDVLFGPIENEQICVNSSALQELSEIPDTETVIFYMPTHRQAFGELAGQPLSDIVFDFEQMDEFLTANDAHLYISLHPYTELEWDDEYDRIEQLDPGDDVYPFLRQADMLVTDYSSVFYDFLLIDRPVLFYAPDFEAYVSSRGLYVDYQSHIPGPLTRSTTELLDALEAQIQGGLNYADERAETLEEYYQYWNDRSAERVYNAIRAKVVHSDKNTKISS